MSGFVGLIRFTEWQRPPITSNRQPRNVYAKGRIVKMIRGKTLELAQNFPAMGKVRVHVTWWVNDKRRRDTDNMQPMLKPIYDGIVDAGIVPDDTPEFMEKPEAQIVFVEPDVMQAHIEVTVEEIR